MRVVIVGAGVGGLALARGLTGRGHEVEVHERASEPRSRALPTRNASLTFVRREGLDWMLTAARPHAVLSDGGVWLPQDLSGPGTDPDRLRPTPDRVRETLFNWLDHLQHRRWEGRAAAGGGARAGPAAPAPRPRGRARPRPWRARPVRRSSPENATGRHR